MNKSYIVNMDRIASFDNNDVYTGPHIIATGAGCRDTVYDELVARRM